MVRGIVNRVFFFIITAFMAACGSSESIVTPVSSAVQLPPQSTNIKISRPENTETPTHSPQKAYKDQGWWQYTHHEYGFSLWLPKDWAVIETTTGDPQKSGHMLQLQPYPEAGNPLSIRMTFRRIGETFPLWPTGVGAGSFEPAGELIIMDQLAGRMDFIGLQGEINSIWYHGEKEPNIQRDEMEFGFILSNTGIDCESGGSINEKEQRVAERIIASLSLP